MRLRPLSEAECYARCYGGRSDDRVSLMQGPVPAASPPPPVRDELREFFAEWLGADETGAGREAA